VQAIDAVRSVRADITAYATVHGCSLAAAARALLAATSRAETIVPTPPEPMWRYVEDTIGDETFVTREPAPDAYWSDPTWRAAGLAATVERAADLRAAVETYYRSADDLSTDWPLDSLACLRTREGLRFYRLTAAGWRRVAHAHVRIPADVATAMLDGAIRGQDVIRTPGFLD
jgi:hypothetical protein